MESVGKLLSEARIAKGLSLEKVSEEVNIRLAYLEALENDEYSKLPEEVFIKGFIRNYGNFLGLNGPELVNLYKANKTGASVEDVESKDIRQVEKVSLNISLKQTRDIGSGTGGINLPKPKLPWKQISVGVVAVLVLAGGYFAVPMLMDAMPSVSLPSLPSFSSSEQPQKKPVAKPQPPEKIYDHVSDSIGC